jgi:hypothetical protein
MTHEHNASAEHDHGPEHDDSLPDARDIPEYENVEDSLAPPLEHDLED